MMMLTIPSSGHSWIKSRRELGAIRVLGPLPLDEKTANIARLAAVRAILSNSLRRVDVTARDFSPLDSALDSTVLIFLVFTFFAAPSPDLSTGLGGLLTWITGIVGRQPWRCACAFCCVLVIDHLAEKTLVSTSDIFRKKLIAVQLVHSMAIL